MSHELFICYDESDKLAADAICHVLEENRIMCWIRSRDSGTDHYTTEITEAIRSSKGMVLVYSELAKRSDYITTEVDMAFSSNIPILVFRVDNTSREGGLEFFLHNQHWLDAYPQPKIQFETLVKDASRLLGKPVNEPNISQPTLDKIGMMKPIMTDGGKSKKSKKHKNIIYLALFFAPIVLFVIGVLMDVMYYFDGLAVISIILAPVFWLILFAYWGYNRFV